MENRTMNLEHYKAASEHTDADERALIPAFKRIRPQTRDEKRDAWNEAEEHRRDLEHESRETEEREATGYWDER
jgi:hypothetical protein